MASQTADVGGGIKMAEFQLGFANEKTVRELSSTRAEPPWLLSERLRALSMFRELPIESQKLFAKYADVRGAKVAETKPYVAPSSLPRSTEGDVEGVVGVFRQREDCVEALYLSEDLRSRGVVLDTLQNAVSRHPELIKPLLVDRRAIPERDKFAQMTKALFMAGIVLHIPDNVSVAHPILLRWLVGRENTALLTRSIVSLGNHSSVAVIEEVESSGAARGEKQVLYGGTTEVLLGESSVLEYNSVENVDGGCTVFLDRKANCGGGSEVHWALGYLGGDMVRSRVDNSLNGRGSSVKEVEVTYGNKSQFFDLFSNTRHVAEDTVSDLLSKGVLQDQSKAYTKGLITIEKGGKGSDSFLGEYGMILSRESRFLAIPSLEIENHEVRRAKHSSSVAQIDESQVFYLMSRGIAENEARKLIVMGFLEPVVARIPLESVANRLRALFEAKWAG